MAHLPLALVRFALSFFARSANRAALSRAALRAFCRLECRGLENLPINCVVALDRASPLAAAVAFAILPGSPIFVVDEAWGSGARRLLADLPVVTLRPGKALAIRKLIKAVRDGATPVFFLPPGSGATRAMKAFEAASVVARKSGGRILRLRVEGGSASAQENRETRRAFFPKLAATLLPSSAEVAGCSRRKAAEALWRSMADLVFETARLDRTLYEAVAAAAREHGEDRPALEDGSGGPLSYREALTRARAIAARLRPHASNGEAIGLLDDGGLGFLAVQALGRACVIIDYDAGIPDILAGLKAAGARTVVVSRALAGTRRLWPLLEALEAETRVIFLEDLYAGLGRPDLLRARLLRSKPLAPASASDVAAVLFTGGAEGPPKYVALSHSNLVANAAQVAAALVIDRDDRVFCAAPLHRGFSLVLGLLTPLLSGVPTRLNAGGTAPDLVESFKATVLMATDGQLADYGRAARTGDFRRLRYAIAAWDPIQPPTRSLWNEKFGLRILESYGATEAGGALALNAPGPTRVSNVGRLLPGVEARLEPVSGGGKRLFVRGVNVMLGYLGPHAPGVARAPEGGWFDTGDIVKQDDEGGLIVQGRVARLARIGPRAVSLEAVEAIARLLWPKALSVAAIVADTRKGERVLLLTTEHAASRVEFASHVKAHGADDLLIPADVIFVETLPLSGCRRPDYVAVTALAQDPSRLAPTIPRAPNGLGRIDGDRMSCA